MENHDDFAFEPIPGLPEKLPTGESMLWQGSPVWTSLAIAAFHVRKVAIYFALILAWQVGTGVQSGAGAGAILTSSAWVVGVGSAAIAILALLAWLYARGTIYTLTTRRLVIRSGLALPLTLNLPLALVETAAATPARGGIGSILLTVARPNRIAYLALWPNARPWRINNPQPLLRCLRDVDAVASLVSKALEADATGARMPAPYRAATRPQGAVAPSTPAAGMAA
ncbi:MAG: photosynthetic complex putative assembly protein PuhB [Mesorhizobium sp.]|nr:photosynthetic complex putative assembly protein PuhB [Mesorhizobium sp.]